MTVKHKDRINILCENLILVFGVSKYYYDNDLFKIEPC